MTAKEKAKELVDSFSPYSDYNECDVFTQRENQLKNAKQCALICVDEFIDALSFNSSPTAEGLTEFYEKVKQEINKL